MVGHLSRAVLVPSIIILGICLQPAWCVEAYDPLKEENLSIRTHFLQALANFSTKITFGALYRADYLESLNEKSRDKALKQIEHAKMAFRLLGAAQKHILSGKLKNQDKLAILAAIHKLRKKAISAEEVGSGNLVLLNALSQAGLALLFNIVGCEKDLDASAVKQLKEFAAKPNFPSLAAIRTIAKKEFGIKIEQELKALSPLINAVALSDGEYSKLKKETQNASGIALYEKIVMTPRRMKLRYLDRAKDCTPMLFVHTLLNTKQSYAFAKIVVRISPKLGGKVPRDPKSAREAFLGNLDEVEKAMILRGADGKIAVIRKISEARLFIKTGIETKGKELCVMLERALS